MRGQGNTIEMYNDTICAPATAPGGALGIIRVSGPKAFDAVGAICTVRCDAVAANTVHYTHIYTSPLSDGHGEALDEVILSVFRAPHSYTGEDSVEISCHGSAYILNKVLELLVQKGCRMARPGEFTMRAFLNGKMDLSQAEAVADLIASTNRATHQMAMRQLRGGISSELSRLRDQLLKLTSLLELELDFSDHEDLEFANRSELLALAQKTDAHITRLADSFHAGNALKNGIPVAIVGAPNVGKSTLLNALLGEERAIVSDIQGTTRDAIEDTIQLDGITFRFIDTAGIRHTDDQIELMGIQRTFAAIDKASIVLWLITDVPTPSELADMQLRCEGKTLLLVQNKSDLHPIQSKSNLNPIQKSDLNPIQSKSTPSCSVCCDSVAASVPSSVATSVPTSVPATTIPISAKFGDGLDTLRQKLIDAAPKTSDSDVIITNTRHYEALCRAHQHLLRVIDGMHQQISGDLLAEDLRLTIDTLAEITGGQITPNEVLGNIFQHFCVGK